MTEDAFRQSIEELLEQGKPAEVLRRYRAYAADCERNRIAISMETLEVVEKAVDALDPQAAQTNVGRQSASETSRPADRSAGRQARKPLYRWWPVPVACAAIAAICTVETAHCPSPLAPPVATVKAPKYDLHSCDSEGDRLYQSGDYAGAYAWDERALGICTQQNLREQTANTLTHLGRDKQAMGHLSEARRLYERALAIRRETGPPLSTAYVLDTLGGLQVQLGDYGAARQSLLESLHLREQGNEPVGVIECKSDLGALALEQKEYADAKRLLLSAVSMAREQNKPDMVAAIRAQLGSVACEEGDLATARALVTESLAYWQKRGHPRWIAATEKRLSAIALSEGDAQEAERLADHSLTLYIEVGDRLGQARASVALANALVKSGDSERSGALYRDALAYAEEFELAPFAEKIRAAMKPNG